MLIALRLQERKNILEILWQAQNYAILGTSVRSQLPILKQIQFILDKFILKSFSDHFLLSFNSYFIEYTATVQFEAIPIALIVIGYH